MQQWRLPRALLWGIVFLLVAMRLEAQTLDVSSPGVSVYATAYAGGNPLDICNVPLHGSDVQATIAFPTLVGMLEADVSLRHGRLRSRVVANVNGTAGTITGGLNGMVTVRGMTRANIALASPTVLAELGMMSITGSLSSANAPGLVQNPQGHSIAVATAQPQVAVSGGTQHRAPCLDGNSCEEGTSSGGTTVTVSTNGRTIGSWFRTLVQRLDGQSTIAEGSWDELFISSLDVEGDEVDLEWTSTTVFELVLRDDVSRPHPEFTSDFSHTVSLWDFRLFNAYGDDVTAAYVITFTNDVQLGPEISDVPQSTVPEPGTMVLVGTALGGLALRRRRRSLSS